MKTRLLVLLFVFAFANLFGQDFYVINFQSWADLESVRVENLTQGTSLTMEPTQSLHLIIKGVSVEEPNHSVDNKLTIFPNPFEHSCKIEFINLNQGLVNLRLFSVSGKLLQYFSDHLSMGKHTYSLSGVPAGSYLVQVQSATNIYSGKLFVTGQSKGTFSLNYTEFVPLKEFPISTNESNVTKVTSSRAGTTPVEMNFWPDDDLQFIGSSSHLPDVSIISSPNGDETFTFIFSNGPVTDSDDNVYKTIVIKNQEWMTENLKSTKYNDGTSIPNVTDNNSWAELTTGAYSWYANNQASYKDTYGAMYNWYAVNTGILCPTGWRVPTDQEYTILLNNIVDFGFPNTNILVGAGNALKSCRQVNSPLGGDCSTNQHPRWRNDNIHHGIDEFGFSGLPGGTRDYYNGTFGFMGDYGYWWTMTENNEYSAFYRGLYYFYGYFGLNNFSKKMGVSVRCFREVGPPPPPSLTTYSVTNITHNSATSGGNVTSEGAADVTERGVVWSTIENPTIDQNQGITNDGQGLGSFISELTGLAPETNYFVRAFATNSIGTAYGNQVSFETEPNPVSWPEGYVHCDGIETQVVDVTNPITGKIWLDRNLGAGQAATSSTDINSYGDLYQWGRFADGHQCRNSPNTSTTSSSSNPGHGSFINNSHDWLNPANAGLWIGAEGINNPCPVGYRVPTDAELEVELDSWGSRDAAGAMASSLKIPMAGQRNYSNGGIYSEGINGFYWSSTAFLTHSRYFFYGINSAQLSSGQRAYGFSVRCIKEDGSPAVPTVGTIPITNITQTSATSGGNISDDGGGLVTARGVVWGLTQFPNIYVNDGITFDGEGIGSYTSQLTGLTAQTFYYVRAYATNSGGTRYGNQDVFETSPLVVGEYPPGFVHCGTPTAVVDVTNPTTGKIWMDRNLGASGVASAIDDESSYGDLYQWGRFADGHHCRNSETTTTLSPTPFPGHGLFILNSSYPNPWHTPIDNTLWQGVNGINRPCPNGYRLPTEMEMDAERQSWSTNNSAGAFESPLKFSLPGLRSYGDGSILALGSEGYFWTSSVIFANSYYLSIYSHSAGVVAFGHARGHSVRCIKDFDDDD